MKVSKIIPASNARNLERDLRGPIMPSIGESVTCAETGRVFTIARDGCSYNYATTPAGEILSDIGVDMRQRRELLDRSKPFTGYLSSDGKRFTGWKGNTLGTVTRSTLVRLTRASHLHGKYVRAVQVRDVHGAMWHGRGSEGIAITLRPLKG